MISGRTQVRKIGLRNNFEQNCLTLSVESKKRSVKLILCNQTQFRHVERENTENRKIGIKGGNSNTTQTRGTLIHTFRRINLL